MQHNEHLRHDYDKLTMAHLTMTDTYAMININCLTYQVKPSGLETWREVWMNPTVLCSMSSTCTFQMTSNIK